MKKIRYILGIALVVLLGACSEDSLDSKSIFEGTPKEQSAFDKWIADNYTTPYNIRFHYRYDDKETENRYNLVPAQFDKSVALAKIMKHVWIDAYKEAAGEDFLKYYCLREMQLIGSAAYNSNETIVLGTAEGGLKVTLYTVNSIDVDEIDMVLLNRWFFKTMHHEFAHILHQTKSFSTDFNLISAKGYRAGDWVNIKDVDAPKFGFVSGYASSEPYEDFVEILSVYVTTAPADWEKHINSGGEEGTKAILAKFNIVKDYLKVSWEVDIDELRKVVLRRSAEVKDLDLKNL